MVATQERHIPLEFHAEASPPLVKTGGAVAVQHVDVEFRLSGERSKPRGMILNWVGGDDRETLLLSVPAIAWIRQLGAQHSSIIGGMCQRPPSSSCRKKVGSWG